MAERLLILKEKQIEGHHLEWHTHTMHFMTNLFQDYTQKAQICILQQDAITAQKGKMYATAQYTVFSFRCSFQCFSILPVTQ